jgi:cytochrome P450
VANISLEQVLHCLYDICAHPEYIGPLREEIESVLAEDNNQLTKKSMTKLRKLDSFIKESQRLSPPGLGKCNSIPHILEIIVTYSSSIVAMRRLVLSDIILSDGTTLPKGTSIAAPSWGVTQDSALWTDPDTFDGFRFAKLRDVPGSENKHQFVMTGPDSLSFGYGTQACPGRFFASNEIKVLLSHILLNYDVKLETSKRPENRFFALSILPDTTAKVFFKRRNVDAKSGT